MKRLVATGHFRLFLEKSINPRCLSQGSSSMAFDKNNHGLNTDTIRELKKTRDINRVLSDLFPEKDGGHKTLLELSQEHMVTQCDQLEKLRRADQLHIGKVRAENHFYFCQPNLDTGIPIPPGFVLAKDQDQPRYDMETCFNHVTPNSWLRAIEMEREVSKRIETKRKLITVGVTALPLPQEFVDDVFESRVKNVPVEDLDLYREAITNERRNVAFEIPGYDKGTYLISSFSLTEDRNHWNYTGYSNTAEVSLDWKESTLDMPRGLYVSLRKMGDAFYNRSSLVVIPFTKVLYELVVILDNAAKLKATGDVVIKDPNSYLQTRLSCRKYLIRIECSTKDQTIGTFDVKAANAHVLGRKLLTSVSGEPMRLWFDKEVAEMPPPRPIPFGPHKPMALRPNLQSVIDVL